MAQLRIHLVRHGEVYNPHGILYGRMPGYHLSERGFEMAARVAEALPERDPHICEVAASPLLRAQQTAAPLAQALGLEVGVEERVIEAGNDFEGSHVTARGVLTTPEWLYMARNPLRPSWGEPYLAQALRVRAAMMSMRARLATAAAARGLEEASGVLVSHQLPIWSTRLFTEGRPLAHDPRRRQCALASLTTFSDGSGTLDTVVYEDIAGDMPLTQPGTGA
ncbi:MULTISPECIES: histidine phosphatase family protein [Brevibacterium]|jgi:broad specificity phosphatase PhoE|uniref:Histidine phosphatase family protein n=1 Tax=Brevibacterium salitolerans TaxID=1403566 RepID=A0ABN2WWZ5_9MICO|nr:histidine phosphatase family protein [Brevibacterium sp.]